MGKEEALLENVMEFITEARAAKERGSYNSATTLFFKALAVLIDYHLLKQEGFIPSNHSERFKLLKEKYLILYRILDKDFPLYQNSYRLKMTPSTVEVLENDVNKIASIIKIKIDTC